MTDKGESKGQRVEYWRDYFATYSDGALIEEMSNHIESAERHIAAKQLLHERKQALEEGVFATAQRANQLSKWAIGIAAVALMVAALQLLFQWRESATSEARLSKQTLSSGVPSNPVPPTPPSESVPARNP